MSKLRKSAKRCPYCMSCGKPNPNGDLLCLAHSNKISDGKGMGKKSDDSAGAIVCNDCHNLIDGRTGKGSREIRHAMHKRAHENTIGWWKQEGYID